MIRGLDTTVLVEAEISEHTNCRQTRELLEKLTKQGDVFGITPQILSEFVHIVTDKRRFENPLTVDQATDIAIKWWNSKESVQVFPTAASTRQQLIWMREFRLGRKRLLDTQLASTYHGKNITSIISSNAKDFAIYGIFDVINTSNP